MEAIETSFNDMQTVKRDFFAMRNGVIADTLRRAGSPFKIIFGLNLPQISEIAARTPHTAGLAERLWANTTTRESMLLAPMLVDRNNFTVDDARRWLKSVPACEVADVLCLKLLRHMSYAPDLAEELALSDGVMQRYAGVRLMFNLVSDDPRRALDYADRLLSYDGLDKACRNVASQLADECRFLLGEDE